MERNREIYEVVWAYYSPAINISGVPCIKSKIFDSEYTAKLCFESQKRYIPRHLQICGGIDFSNWKVKSGEGYLNIIHPLGIEHGFIKIKLSLLNLRTSWIPDLHCEL